MLSPASPAPNPLPGRSPQVAVLAQGPAGHSPTLCTRVSSPRVSPSSARAPRARWSTWGGSRNCSPGAPASPAASSASASSTPRAGQTQPSAPQPASTASHPHHFFYYNVPVTPLPSSPSPGLFSSVLTEFLPCKKENRQKRGDALPAPSFPFPSSGKKLCSQRIKMK